MKNSSTLKSQTIALARQEFLSRGSVQEGTVAEAIERSWRRCLTSGLDVEAPRDLVVVTAQELMARKAQNQLLLTHAEPEMLTLSEQIAHTRSLVILTDHEGVILRSMGDDSIVNDEAERAALMPGASWSEAHRGTNAIGTALIEQSAITVQGAEHFMAHHHALSCSAVPIFGAQSELLATLDVSNDLSVPQQHTLALVKMAAQMIENRLFRASHQADIAVHFHARPEFIGTLWEGIAMFSADGRLLAMNRSGQFQFNLNLQTRNLLTLDMRFEQLFDMPMPALLRQTSAIDPIVFPLRLHTGARIYARVERLQTLAIAEASPNKLKRSSAASLDMLNSGDPQVAAAILQVKQVLNRDIPILIQGETGTGKELFARAIHEAGARHDKPWIAVNCAALPEGLIEAELFGYEEGAFTGAKRKGSAGKIEQADGGTLFLDEIGDMPLSLQARLLRVLQERTVTPLGSTKSIAVNFSLISATNQQLKEKVAAGAFRSDLYYRLNGLSVNLPALRERTDLASLMRIILQIEQVGDADITPPAMQLLAQHPWPGNIRQLHNVMRTALALADGNAIAPMHFTRDFMEEMTAKPPAEAQHLSAQSPAAVDLTTLAPQKSVPEKICEPATGAAQGLKQAADDAIKTAMQQHSGNVSAVARQLGVSRNTLYRKLRALGLA